MPIRLSLPDLDRYTGGIAVATLQTYPTVNEASDTSGDDPVTLQWSNINTLKIAQRREVRYLVILLERGSVGREVRAFMQSKSTTPYIVRSKCVSHPGAFVAAIRPAKFALAVDVYDSPSCPDWCLITIAGRAPVAYLPDKTGAELATALWDLRIAGFTLASLLDAEHARQVSSAIARRGSAMIRKQAFIKADPGLPVN